MKIKTKKKQQRLQEDQTTKIKPKQQRSNPNRKDQTQTMKIISKQRKSNHDDKGDLTQAAKASFSSLGLWVCWCSFIFFSNL